MKSRRRASRLLRHGLKQKRRTKKRLPKREPVSMVVIDRINAVWALDFMFDALYGGRLFRRLNVIDEADRGPLESMWG